MHFCKISTKLSLSVYKHKKKHIKQSPKTNIKMQQALVEF